MPDKMIDCMDCRTPFNFTEGEQKFFLGKGFSFPKRCKPCREAKKMNANDGNRETYNPKY